MSETPHTRLRCEDRRCQILSVATRLFANKGFNGVTTREIAQQAGVNEALIFRHFSSKQELYWSVLESRCDLESKRRFIEDVVEREGSPREILVAIIERILSVQGKDMTMVRLMFYSVMENHELSERFFKGFMQHQYGILENYCTRLIQEGRLRPLPDVKLAVRGFMGMILYHSIVQNLFQPSDERKYTPREAAETLADIWMRGIEAR